MKLCECGCGTPVGVSNQNRWDGLKRGEPLRFIKGHHFRTLTPHRKGGRSGENHHNWKGGRTLTHGYVYLHRPGHPKADHHGYIREHVLVVETAIGKPLPAKAVVHHIDANPQNNRNDNLVACQDQGYHRLLHLRQNALAECGHADWRKCPFCKEWTPANEMKFDGGGSYAHAKCRYKYNRARLDRLAQERAI